MTSLADKSLLSGGDNKPPMLEKHLYDSWKSRMELYMMNRPHGRMILASVEKGPLVWPSITEDGVTRLKEYVELTPAEAIQADCDIKAINIILQGLPTEIYALVSQHRVAKDLWEKIKLLMQGTSLTKQERECKLYDEFDKFTYKRGETLHEYYLRFTLLLNDMNIYKMPLEQFQVNTKFLNTLPDEWSKFVTDVKLVKDLHTTNVDQLHAHLQQHERHAIEVRLMHERNPDPLALVASHQSGFIFLLNFSNSSLQHFVTIQNYFPEGVISHEKRGLPRDIPLDSLVALMYEKRSKSENKGIVSTEMELVLGTKPNKKIPKTIPLANAEIRPLLKQGEYDTWRLRIELYIQLQDYALWEIIEEGNSFKPIARTTTNEDGTSTTTIPGAITAEQKILKKNDLKARSILMMTLPTTKKTQKTLLKQMYETFNASSSESLDFIFNRLQKIISQLTILGEIITPEELNLKFLRSLPTEWGHSSTNDVNTANVHVSTGSTPVSTASTNNSIACLNGTEGFIRSYMAGLRRLLPNLHLLLSHTLKVERLKKEKEDNQFKIDKFKNASKSLDQLIRNQISDNNKKSLGYNVVPPPLTGLFAPPSIDLSNSGLEKFKQPEFKGYGVKFTPKACFVCGSFNHLIKDCDFHDKRMVQKPVLNNVKKGTSQREVRQVWTNAMRVNHQKISNSRRNFAPTAVFTKSGLVPFSTTRKNFSRTAAPVSAARPFNTAVHKPFVNIAKPRTNAFQKSHSFLRRPFCQQTTFKNKNLSNKVNTVKANSVNTAKGKRMTSVVGKQGINVVKPTAYWAWRPKIKMINHVYKNTGSCICKQFNYVDPTGRNKVFNFPCFTANSWLVQDQTVLALAIPGQTATGKESSNPFMAGSLPKTINSNNVDEESQKIGRQAQVMISDAEEYLISEDPVKQGRMEETENA
ncbi:hypothetical protein Tco_0006202 [Tanacetum coccineum]